MDEGNVLNDVLQRTLDFVDRGFSLIQGDVYWLFGLLLVLNLVLAGLTWATSEDDVLIALARRVIYLGFFAWLVMNWPTLVGTVGDSFVKLGLKAGNAAGLERDFYNPGRVVSVGWSGAWDILEVTGQFTGVRATFVNLPQIFILLIASIVYFVCFALLAFQVFLALVQFKVGTLASFVLLPMALVNKTAFLAERPIGWVIASGVRLMMLAVVMALAVDLVNSVATLPDGLTIRQAVAAALGAAAIFLLARLATNLASDLVQGSPSLGADGASVAGAGTHRAGQTARLAAAGARPAASAAGRATRMVAAKAAALVPGGAVATTAAAATRAATKVSPSVSKAGGASTSTANSTKTP